MSVSSYAKRNLTYESKEPAFLRKLRSEYGGTDSDRHQRSLTRPKRQRDANEGDDDEPVYTYEENPNASISKADYDALLNASAKKQESAEETHRERSDEQLSDMTAIPSVPRAKENLDQGTDPQQCTTVIGAASKKRSLKIIGDDTLTTGAKESVRSSEVKTKHSSKQVKKPKLSFQED